MNFFHDVKKMRYLTILLGILSVCSSMLHLFFHIYIPGFEPLLSASFWCALWRWSKLDHKLSQKSWTWVFLFIIAMNLHSGVSQILSAIK